MAKNNAPADEEESAGFELVPSEVDELTHAELCLLYRESTDTVRFAKRLQWWTVGSTLLVDGAIVLLGKYAGPKMVFVNQLTGALILITMGVVLTLVIYQLWQHTENAKINEISRQMSNLFSRIRRMKSKREANIQRYLLLSFMLLTVMLGAAISWLGLQQVITWR